MKSSNATNLAYYLLVIEANQRLKDSHNRLESQWQLQMKVKLEFQKYKHLTKQKSYRNSSATRNAKHWLESHCCYITYHDDNADRIKEDNEDI